MLRWLTRRKPAALTFVVINYQQDAYLPDCLAAIAQQTRPDWEAVVVHQGPAEALVSALAPVHGDARVRVVQNDRPLSALGARRRGLAEVTTPLTAMIDADDMVTLRFAEALVGTQNRTGADVAIGRTLRVLPDGREVPHRYRGEAAGPVPTAGTRDAAALFLRDHGFPMLWDSVFATELLRAAFAEIPPELQVNSADDRIVKTLAFTWDISFARVEDVVLRYRVHPTSTSHRPGVEAGLDRLEDALRAYRFLYDLVQSDDRRRRIYPWLPAHVSDRASAAILQGLWRQGGLGALPAEARDTVIASMDFETALVVSSLRRTAESADQVRRLKRRLQRIDGGAPEGQQEEPEELRQPR